MKNLKDTRTNIFPSKTRGGRELPSSFVVDSPSVLSQLATPPHAINSNMLQVIDDATSTMNDAYDDASTLLDNDDMPLGKFLDEQLARVRENENIESDNIDESDGEDLPVIPKGQVFDKEASLAILACKDR